MNTVRTIDHLVLFSHSVLSDSFVTPGTIAQQVHLSMGFPRQEYWSGLPFPPPVDLPDPGIELMSPACRQILLLSPLSHMGSQTTLSKLQNC